MITLLENVLERADGNYVTAQDLRLLDKALSSWQARKEAYNNIQVHEAEIINQAVEAMRTSDRFTAKPMDTLGVDRCRRDMILGLRCCALAMLLEDAEMLKDRVLYWQQNIFLAMQLNYHGYKFIWLALQSQLPKEQAELFSPYLKIAHEMMSGK
ncbi:Phycobilisome protein [Synechococcus sp. PCC 7502]|uniref:phycobilisome protein n=1 Tax=Synechococcus sp. PCC 7502 TaxID=1173263 RepID=UPI0002A000F4|nr:phycobilisome protein [Synechococcus sp. PCC 7502]AFY73809.1 Phycobilisome protein [Synechococcus sp. PCC 7502]